MGLVDADLRRGFYERSKPLLSVRRCHNLIELGDKTNDKIIGKARDLALLEWLCNNKYTDLYIIGKITKNKWNNNIYKQIAFLLNQRFIRKVKIKGYPVYRITRLGVQYCNKEMGENYSIEIARARCSPSLYSHTMLVQYSLYDHFLRMRDNTTFLSEYRVATMWGWLDEVQATLPKVPDIIAFTQNDQGRLLSLAVEVEIEPKKKPALNIALYGMDRLVNRTVVDSVEYCFITEGAKSIYWPYFFSGKIVYDYNKGGEINRYNGNKIERPISNLTKKGLLHISDCIPSKKNKVPLSLQVDRYLHDVDRTKPSRNNSAKQTDRFSIWINKAEKEFTNKDMHNFKIINDFLNDVINIHDLSLMGLPRNQRKLLAEMLLLPDYEDYDTFALKYFIDKIEDEFYSKP